MAEHLLMKADSEWYTECHPLNDLGTPISDDLWHWFQSLCNEMADFDKAFAEAQKENGQ